MRKFLKRLALIIGIFLIVPPGLYRPEIVINHPTIVFADDTGTTAPLAEEEIVTQPLQPIQLPNTYTTYHGETLLEPEEFDYAWVLLLPPVLICGLCLLIVSLNKKSHANN